MTRETLDQIVPVLVTAQDVELLDALGTSYSKQVLETRMNGGRHTEADDERSNRAYDLAEKIGHYCLDRDDLPKEGEFQVSLDDEEEGLLTEARHLIRGLIPNPRSA